MENKPISAIVLAGGYSSRMGRNKAELGFHGVSLIRYQVEKIRTLGIEDIVIAGYSKPVEGTRYVPDVYPHRGPLSGVHAGLLAVRSRSALVLAVDTPLIPETLLRELIESHRTEITLVLNQGEPEPLIGVYDKELSQACASILQGDKTSMWRLLDKVGPAVVPYQGDAFLLRGCNTPEEYQNICEHRI